jgi:hypothetical protein
MDSKTLHNRDSKNPSTTKVDSMEERSHQQIEQQGRGGGAGASTHPATALKEGRDTLAQSRVSLRLFYTVRQLRERSIAGLGSQEEVRPSTPANKYQRKLPAK